MYMDIWYPFDSSPYMTHIVYTGIPFLTGLSFSSLCLYLIAIIEFYFQIWKWKNGN